ncbi:vWA domain-containing protein [Nocardioides daeguensis]|uniref:VWA domain-containing protein n=1 Tax=Nocardioides daeguensis TaxID=908359 RepID=A0ABP6V891_9ACTN|nr:VWA domain-containing protein [Nocardioides daeguensis]MBV6726413.1 VWA domain-containing protein [Nocardioides daeguensis]MCR1772256.1 VWA domain-containing protein [Nocardioides daeguensis]
MDAADQSGLLDRHLAFVEALRGAGLSVSLAEDIDSLAALGAVRWGERAMVRDAFAATMVKKQAQRTTFDALFDVYFPAMVGDGAAAAAASDQAGEGAVRDNATALVDFRDRLAEALEAAQLDDAELRRIAAEMVGVFGAMPGRGPGLSSWSAYTALQRVAPQELVDKLVAGLMGEGVDEEDARRQANRRVGSFTAMVEEDARRRIAEEKGPDHVADVAIRPSIDKLAFMAARRTDLDEMRKEIFPLARRLATRLAKEQHSWHARTAPLDFRRTVRASIATGGVPITTHHRPKRPHRTDLVVLCDVSGSVANFAQFTLLFVFALREVFQSMRAFTFIDHVHEVTGHFRPGADPVDVLSDLAAATSHAALWGRTNYGRAFTKFEENHLDALTPKTTLLILGDARSNYSDLHEDALRRLTGSVKRTFWLNPEHEHNWGTGDSAAPAYGEIVRMIECRNLTQLGEFVHDLAW